MRLRKIPEAEGVVENSPYVVHDPAAMRGSWKNDPLRPLFLEIGMGKGRFLIEMAAAHPEADFLGIERYSSVLFRACERMAGIPYNTPADQIERAEHPERDAGFVAPANLRFLSVDARDLTEFFSPGEIDGIFLNFSDPWPKARHSDRRLTSAPFLKRYEQVLREGGTLEFKTDNRGLFDFSLEEIRNAPHFELLEYTYDLHRDPVMSEGNIMTEYERKFSRLGNRICKLKACFHKTERG